MFAGAAHVLQFFDRFFLPDYYRGTMLSDKRELTGWKLDYMRQKWETCGAYQLGLKENDLFDDSVCNPIIVEAVRRLSLDPDPVAQDIYDRRCHRMIRAIHLDATGAFRILPKEDWMKFEDDDPYLIPYIKEVLSELDERKEWVATHGA